MYGVVLYGPPASGKDTISKALIELDPAYELYQRIKVGPGRTTGYRMATETYVDALRASGGVVWENRRYDSLYVVDRPSLLDRLADHVPIVHLGQSEAVAAVTGAVPEAEWLVVSLWCPRDVALRRIVDRATGDTEARLHAWDATAPLAHADIAINTAKTSPSAAARKIHQRARIRT